MSRDQPRANFEPEAFRKKHNRLLGIGSELIAPVLRLGGSVIARRPPSDPATWRTGLILGHNHIGDILYRTCSLQELRRHLPDCRWSYLTSATGREILGGNADIDEVIALNIGDDSWNLADEAFRELRRRDFDAVLCTNTIRYQPDLFLATSLGIPNRVAFTHKGLSGLATRSINPTYPSPFPAYFRTMVAAITGVEPSWSLHPRIFPDESDRRAAAAVIRESGLEGGTPIVAATIVTRQLHGNWPSPSLLNLLRELSSRASFRLALCGERNDAHVLESVSGELDQQSVVLAGKLTIRQFAAFLEDCAALVTIDSGPRHIGNAVKIPVYFFRNLLHSQVEAGRYCDTETDLAPPGEFLSDDAIARVANEFDLNAAAEMLADQLKASATPA